VRVLPLQAYLPTLRGLAENALRRGRVHPFYASLKVTSRCHFGCPFCNMRAHKTPDLSTDEIKSIMRNLSRSSVLMTSFEGGEPLLREDIGELLRFARECRFYLLFTTSARNLLDYPMAEYARYIDFLHVSIDEGHGNLEMLDLLPRLSELPVQLSVQTVVTSDTVGALEEKVRRCHAAGANIVIIAASPMESAENHFPDMDAFEREVARLRKKYPLTIHTPAGYFDAFRKGKCSSASIIIGPDGRLFYPCHILGDKGPDLRTTDLSTWLRTPEAKAQRAKMAACKRNCGWYQYYSIDSYTSVASVVEALRPVLGNRGRSAERRTEPAEVRGMRSAE